MGVSIDIPVGSSFTIHNIPFGVISTEQKPAPRCATAIGNYAIDLVAYSAGGRLIEVDPSIFFQEVFSLSTLNTFAALPQSIRRQVRQKIIEDIQNHDIDNDCLIPLDKVTMHLPMRIGGFSDFYCSLEHCQNSTSYMSGGTQIPKNWFYAPSVYNSRVSSVIPSPRPVRRPRGVYFKDGDIPAYGPSDRVDYELEMGFFVSKPIPFGSELSIGSAPEHIFGFVLLNDWSARDLQMFESKPLGPFNGKGFGTSISTWVVTMDALTTFRCSPKTIQDPPPFEHLSWNGKDDGAIDVALKVTLRIRKGQDLHFGNKQLEVSVLDTLPAADPPCLSRVWNEHGRSAWDRYYIWRFKCFELYKNLDAIINLEMQAVDSEGNKTELGCLYEATQGGDQWVYLEDGTKMKYLEDHDEIVLEGWCKDKNGEVVLGFGECRGKVLPSLESRL